MKLSQVLVRREITINISVTHNLVLFRGHFTLEFQLSIQFMQIINPAHAIIVA